MPRRHALLMAFASTVLSSACGGAEGPTPVDVTDAAADTSDPGADSTRADASAEDSASDVVVDTKPGSDATTDTVGEAGSTELVIMPLGDSITGEPHTYRETLYTKLTGAGCKVHFVGSQNDVYATIPEKNHEGHPGFTVSNIATSIDSWLAGAPPKYVLLMIGTNDIAWWFNGVAADVADEQAKLIDRILVDVPGVWLVVASIPPEASKIIDPKGYDRATLATAVNAELKKRVDTRIAAGKKLRFADVNAALVVGDLRDGIHPTTAGYDKVANVWFGALKPIAGCLGGTP